jgi:hypothetical protein
MRRVERPRPRYLKDVEYDHREMNEKRWRQKAVYREKWMLIIREAKVLRGP